jgi:hypothetical protein
MNKSSTPSLKNFSFDEDWSSHPAIEWLLAHRKILLWTFFFLIAVLILVSWLVTLRALNTENDFFQAQTAFTQFQQAAITPIDNSSDVDLEQVEAIMQRHPELQPKYEGPLAQTLLINGQIPQAKVFIQDVFNRTQPDHLSLYQDYTQTSILIGEERYFEALQQAQQLKSTLDQLKVEATPILYVFNLIRLAMLFQQTGQPEQELKAWEELQNQPQRTEAVLAASQVLKVGQASLNQYIEERRHVLAHMH